MWDFPDFPEVVRSIGCLVVVPEGWKGASLSRWYLACRLLSCNHDEVTYYVFSGCDGRLFSKRNTKWTWTHWQTDSSNWIWESSDCYRIYSFGWVLNWWASQSSCFYDGIWADVDLKLQTLYCAHMVTPGDHSASTGAYNSFSRNVYHEIDLYNEVNISVENREIFFARREQKSASDAYIF